MSAPRELCRYIHQRRLGLFVFHLQVSVIVALRHNKLSAESVHRPGDDITFQSQTFDVEAGSSKSAALPCSVEIKVHTLHQKSYLFGLRLQTAREVFN